VIDLIIEKGKVKGVVARDGARIVTIPSSLVIAADGSFKHIARQAKLEFIDGPISVPIGYEYCGVKRLEGPDNLVEIYLDDSGEGRFNAIFPHGGDRLCIGCSVIRHNFKQNKTLKQRLDEFVAHLEDLGRYDFRRASPVGLVSGGMMVSAIPRLAADGIILAGNAAGPPLYGSRSGGRTMMLGACWSGRVAGEMAARAVRKGGVSGDALDKEYKDIIHQSLQGDGANVQDALGVWRTVFNLDPDQHERVLADLGKEVAALHFYSKGALPLAFCREPLQKWLKDNGRTGLG
jgi:flavin-dependent dehydrogenase